MAKKPEKRVRITTPAGTLKFGAIEKPRLKFQSEDEYEYNVELILSPDDGQKLYDQLIPLALLVKKKALAEAETGKDRKAIEACELHVPVAKELDKDGEETGNWVLKAKRDAEYINKKTKEVVQVTIPIFDSNQKLVTGVRIGRGSKLRVAFDANEFCMVATKKVGISARLQAVQILELKEYIPGGGASSYGFDIEEGGYSAPENGDEEAPFDGGVADTGEGGGDDSDGADF